MQKLFSVLIALALVFAPVTAFAQGSDADTPYVFCGDLSDEDCQLLTDAQAASAELTNMVVDITMDFSGAGIPGVPVAEVAGGLDLTMRMNIDPDFAVELQAMNQDPEAMAALFQDADSYLAFISDFYNNVDMIQEYTIRLSDDTVALIEAQPDAPSFPGELSFSMVMVDGMAYMNMSGFAALDDSGEMDDMPEWIGFELVPMIEASMQQPETAQMMQMQSAMMGSMMGMTVQGPSPLEEFMGVERLDDSEVGGVEVATFSHTFDLAGYLASPQFNDLLMSLPALLESMEGMEGMEDLGSLEEMGLTEESLAEVSMMVGMVAPMLLGGLEYESLTFVAIDEPVVQASEFNLEWDLTSIMGLIAMGQGMPATRPETAPVISFSVLAENSELGVEQEIEAPEGAEILSVEEMMESSD